ncbi:MAG: hypothetical protein ACOY9Y_01370 [Bacillota bacterium]
MKNEGVRKVFPGGNTSQGFYSFYHHIIPLDATRIFVLKGGPGVGKSTFMKTIAESLIANGYSVEYHCCSSDNNSLDGVVIPEIAVALIDGTAPHGVVSTQKTVDKLWMYWFSGIVNVLALSNEAFFWIPGETLTSAPTLPRAPMPPICWSPPKPKLRRMFNVSPQAACAN